MVNSKRVEVDLQPDLASLSDGRLDKAISPLTATSCARLVCALRDQQHEAQLDALRTELRQKIASDLASLRGGESLDGDSFMAALDVELAHEEQRAT